MSHRKHDVEMDRIAIDACVAKCDLPGDEFELIEGLEQALRLALSLRDTPRVAKVRDAIISLQARISDPAQPRSVYFHFDLLYEQRKQVKLTSEQISNMIAGMERQLAKWADPACDQFDPTSARKVGQRLAQHFRVMNDAGAMKHVILTYGRGIQHALEQASGLSARRWLEELHRDYLEARLRTEADALLAEIEKAGHRMESEMRTVSTSMTIPAEKMEKFLNAFFVGDIEDAVSRIVGRFTPSEEDLRQAMYDSMKKHPLLYMTSVMIGGKFTRARIGSITDDEPGRLVAQMRDHMAYESPFLQLAMERLISRYSLAPEQILALLYKSELFEESRKALLMIGIKHYLTGDHTSCVHILIPQIERLLRSLLKSLGGVTVSLDNETQTYRDRDLGSVLHDPLMKQFWKLETGRDIALYLCVVLTDQRGLNARNKVCHGLCDSDWFTSLVADRLMLILLMLSRLRREAT